jgi:RNA polymerase sigma-70 factor (ECF subfamily)
LGYAPPHTAIFPEPVRSTSMVEAVETRKPTDLDFEVIYNTHYRRVLSLCRFLLNSPDKAEDAAHEAFLRAQARMHSYNPAYPLSTWLLKIASNYCIDLLRRKTAETRIFDYEPGQGNDPPAGGPSPLGQILAAEQGRDVRKALSSLSEKYRVPLVLAYYNELSYEEIAEILGVERTQVAVLIFRGKEHLRNRLGKGLGKENLQ